MANHPTEQPAIAAVEDVLETCLYVRDLEAAGRFYEEILGLERVASDPGRHVFLRCGRRMVLLFDPEVSRQAESREEDSIDVPPHGATGPGHVAFLIRAEHVGAWKDRLLEKGVAIEREIEWPHGARSVYFRDPAGNSLELATAALWGLRETERDGGDG